MDTANNVVTKLWKSIDVIFLVYAIKRNVKIPSQYNQLVYALILSPLMLANGLWCNDLIAFRYRAFLAYIAYPKAKLYPSLEYRDCHTHKRLANEPLDADCWELSKKEIPLTIKRVLKLYSRFYLLQLLIVASYTKKLTLKSVKNAALNTFWSSLFLGGQTIAMRAQLCWATKQGYGLSWFRMWMMSVIPSFCIYAERTDRVGQINNLVLAHILIGWLKKYQALGLRLSLPIFLATVAKDKGKLKPITFLIAMASTVVF